MPITLPRSGSFGVTVTRARKSVGKPVRPAGDSTKRIQRVCKPSAVAPSVKVKPVTGVGSVSEVTNASTGASITATVAIGISPAASAAYTGCPLIACDTMTVLMMSSSSATPVTRTSWAVFQLSAVKVSCSVSTVRKAASDACASCGVMTTFAFGWLASSM